MERPVAEVHPDMLVASDLGGLALSALLDDELRGSELEATLSVLLTDGSDVVARWSTYHVVRENLREGVNPAGMTDMQFLRTLHDAAGIAPATSQPRDATVLVAPFADSTGVGGEYDHSSPSANQARGGWRVAAAVASLAALALLSWQTLPGSSQRHAAPQIADSALGPMQRDPQLDALLAAHVEVATGLPSPAAEVRRAALVGVSR